MGNIITAKVTIEGVRPLFQHKFGPEALPLEKQERTGVAGNDPEEWRRTCMITKSGQLYVDGSYVFSMMGEAAKYTKRGRAGIQKYVMATLQVIEERILLDRFWPSYPNGHDFSVDVAEPPPTDSDEPVYLDVRGVRNPSTKARNVRYRIATAPGWQAGFTLIWDKTIVSRHEMEAVAIDAGKLVGLANARTIGMGRFDVASFDVSE